MTTTVTAFIPAQRPASDPVTTPAPAVPAVPGPRVPDAAASAAGVWLPRTAAERRAYARQVVADAYYDLYCDAFGASPGGAR